MTTATATRTAKKAKGLGPVYMEVGDSGLFYFTF